MGHNRQRKGMLEAETPLKASSREVGTQREATPMESSTGYCRSSLPGFEAPGVTSALKQARPGEVLAPGRSTRLHCTAPGRSHVLGSVTLIMCVCVFVECQSGFLVQVPCAFVCRWRSTYFRHQIFNLG